MDALELSDQAERAVAAGDLQRAISLLQQVAALRPDDITNWMKIAAMYRGLGDIATALVSVQRALAVVPLDFTALLMRASLLQRLGDPAAGEAWGHALAQKPADPPAELAPVIAQAESHHTAWVTQREADMKRRLAAAEGHADGDERQRIRRFRDNVLRRARPYHSEPTHYHFPALPEREFHPRSLFPWLDHLEAATSAITAELEQVMRAERAELVPYVQYEDYLPMDQWRALNRNRDWTAIHLLEKGSVVDANAAHCPQTMALLAQMPQPQVSGASPNAMFSLLAPCTAIPPHVGISNTRLVCHLPLIVPDGCWFRVGAETRYWKAGEAFVFDDTIEHEALNPSDQLRVVFIFDIWAPDLTPPEREAVAAVIGLAPGEDGGL